MARFDEMSKKELAEITSKGGKAKAKADAKAKEVRENMELTAVMEELLKTKDYKQRVCKAFLDGKFSAKSMEVLLKMLNTDKEKPTTLDDFINEN